MISISYSIKLFNNFGICNAVWDIYNAETWRKFAAVDYQCIKYSVSRTCLCLEQIPRSVRNIELISLKIIPNLDISNISLSRTKFCFFPSQCNAVALTGSNWCIIFFGKTPIRLKFETILIFLMLFLKFKCCWNFNKTLSLWFEFYRVYIFL